MISVVMLLGCIGMGKYQVLEQDLDRSRAELSAASTARATLEDALATEQARSARLSAEKARLVSDASALKGSVVEMEAALREAAARKSTTDARMAEYKGLLERFRPLIDAGTLRVKIVEGKMVVELASDVLFASGSATLSPEGGVAIAEVSRVLKSIPDRAYQVEGHTDNVPINTAQYPTNWELASGRAVMVLKAMVTAGLPAARVSAASFGSEHPVAKNDSETGRGANRRIEIVVVPDLSMLPGFEELKLAATR